MERCVPRYIEDKSDDIYHEEDINADSVDSSGKSYNIGLRSEKYEDTNVDPKYSKDDNEEHSGEEVDDEVDKDNDNEGCVNKDKVQQVNIGGIYLGKPKSSNNISKREGVIA